MVVTVAPIAAGTVKQIALIFTAMVCALRMCGPKLLTSKLMSMNPRLIIAEVSTVGIPTRSTVLKTSGSSGRLKKRNLRSLFLYSSRKMNATVTIPAVKEAAAAPYSSSRSRYRKM